MSYLEFRDKIEKELRSNPQGRTWVELRERLDLPYEKSCPTWTGALEREIGLRRVKGPGRALIWKLEGQVSR